MKNKFFFISLFSFSLFIIDRIIKYLALNKLQSSGVYLFEKIIYLKLEKNTGVAFSIVLPKIIIISLIILILFFLFYFLIKSYKNNNGLIFFLGTLIIIGAISNLIDRIIYNYVIDFINISILPTFNLSDFYIFIAVLIYLFLETKKTPLDKAKGVL